MPRCRPAVPLHLPEMELPMNSLLPPAPFSPALPCGKTARPAWTWLQWLLCCCVLSVLAFLSGCGSLEFPLAKVRGKVLCDGAPLAWGEVIFTPRPAEGGTPQLETGKAATGQIGEDGQFELSTYAEGDGAIVGRHEVQVLPSGLRGENEPFPCMTTGGYFVEVTEGDNELTLELSSEGN